MFRTNNTNYKGPGPATPHFPTYLLPSLKIPFFRKRRQSSTTTNDVPSLSSSPVSATSFDGDDEFPSPPANTETFTYDISDDKPASKPTPATQQPTPRGDRLARVLPDVLRCNTCGTDVAYGLQIVSKGFTGRHGRALLVSPPLSSSQPSCPGSDYHLPTRSGSSVSGGRSTAPVLSPGHHTLARDGADLVNITVGRPESRNLVTGAHVVADINCATCGVKIGWKYVDAREQAQKYKVGKFILETERVVLYRSWEDVLTGQGEPQSNNHFYSASAPAAGFGGRRRSSAFGEGGKVSFSSEGEGRVDGYVVEEEGEQSGSGGESEEEIMFDSDDDDECEDIFAGIWDAATVARRRGSKVGGSKRYGARKGRAADKSR